MRHTIHTLARRGSIAAALLIGTLAWLLGTALAMVPATGLGAPASGSPDGPVAGPAALTPWSAVGPHPVGVRSLSGEDAAPAPDLTIWYPATAEADEADGRQVAGATYAYELKVFDPIGTTALATFAGRARTAAEPDISAGPYPLVILSPGFAVGAASYAWLGEHLASHGWVVVTPDHDEQLDPNRLWRTTIERPDDVLATLDAVDRLAGPGGRFHGLIDTDSVVAVGHSAGGFTALAAVGARIHTGELLAACDEARVTDDPVTFQCDALLPHLDDMATLAGLDAVPTGLWPAAADPRVDAAVVLAGDALAFGKTGLAPVAVPVLAVGGTADHDSPFAWGTGPAWEHTTGSTRVQVALEGAEHMIFAGRCESVRLVLRLTPTMFCADPAWDRAEAQRLVAGFTTAFLDATVEGDADAARALATVADAGPGDGLDVRLAEQAGR